MDNYEELTQRIDELEQHIKSSYERQLNLQKDVLTLTKLIIMLVQDKLPKQDLQSSRLQ